MGSGEELRKPKDLERLDKNKRIERLHHQLGVIYDKVFLTGDWTGEFVGQEHTLRASVFEEREITDAKVLEDAIGDFIASAEVLSPRKMRVGETRSFLGKHEANRILFIEAAKYIRDILHQTLKDIGTKEELQMEKCIDENIHFFRDMDIRKRGDHKETRGITRGVVSDNSRVALDEERFAEGLSNITERLASIRENVSPWNSPPETT